MVEQEICILHQASLVPESRERGEGQQVRFRCRIERKGLLFSSSCHDEGNRKGSKRDPGDACMPWLVG